MHAAERLHALMATTTGGLGVRVASASAQAATDLLAVLAGERCAPLLVPLLVLLQKFLVTARS